MKLFLCLGPIASVATLALTGAPAFNWVASFILWCACFGFWWSREDRK